MFTIFIVCKKTSSILEHLQLRTKRVFYFLRNRIHLFLYKVDEFLQSTILTDENIQKVLVLCADENSAKNFKSKNKVKSIYINEEVQPSYQYTYFGFAIESNRKQDGDLYFRGKIEELEKINFPASN